MMDDDEIKWGEPPGRRIRNDKWARKMDNWLAQLASRPGESGRLWVARQGTVQHRRAELIRVTEKWQADNDIKGTFKFSSRRVDEKGNNGETLHGLWGKFFRVDAEVEDDEVTDDDE